LALIGLIIRKFVVMAGLVPAIHVPIRRAEDVDARHKAGHDERCWFS
jgi:hypothetical protein